MSVSRPTQKDVAKAAGVHRATVSLVFRNHPSIPETTKEHVRKAAKRIGYSPDPMLSALAVYRSRHRPRAFQGVLVWLVNNLAPYKWTDFSTFKQYYQGAKARAEEQGYRLEISDLHGEGMTTSRLVSIFRSRNIRGILVCPQPRPHFELQFPWENFSSVTFGHTLAKPKLHTVVPGQMRAMTLTMEHLIKANYRKIGLVLSSEHDERTDHNFLSGYLLAQHLAGNRPLTVSSTEVGRDPEKLRNWLKRNKPDAIVSGHWKILDALYSIGLLPGRDIGIACPCLPDDRSSLSGVCEDSIRIGQIAADLVISMVQQGEWGVPESPQRILIEGRWLMGGTIRSMPEENQAPDRQAEKKKLIV